MRANYDAGGNDIECITRGTPNDCKVKCDANPECVGYNEVKPNGVWGSNFGCCLKRAIVNPGPIDKIDFYTKLLNTFGLGGMQSSPMRYIRISRRTPGVVHISEIQAYDAAGKPIPFITASYGPSGDTANGLNNRDFPPINAIDGNFTSFAHTNDNMASFLQVDLGSEFIVSKIEITNREGYEDRMVGTNIEFFNGRGGQATPTIPIDAPSRFYSFEFRPPTMGSLLASSTTAGKSQTDLEREESMRLIMRPFRGRINLPQYLRHLQNKNYLLY
jgi:hypothetical protein